MNKLAAAVIIGSTAGVGYFVIRGVRNANAASQPKRGTGEPSPEPPLVLAPAAGPETPLREPEHPTPNRVINQSYYNKKTGTVHESPTKLLTQALRHDPNVTIEELTGARLAKSEHGTGSFTELACIVDAELNRALRRGRTLYQSLTYRDTFGKQGRQRRASTRQDPEIRHLLAARAVLSGRARGIARGAIRFFDPAVMESGHRKWRAWLARGKTGDKPSVITCDALGLLEAWSFDYGYHSKYRRCPPNKEKLGSSPQAWVGPIAGVDPFRLLLMKPMKRGPEHTRRYEAARAAAKATRDVATQEEVTDGPRRHLPIRRRRRPLGPALPRLDSRPRHRKRRLPDPRAAHRRRRLHWREPLGPSVQHLDPPLPGVV